MSDMNSTPHTQAIDRKKRIWAIVGASSGNLVEWFDFYVYSFSHSTLPIFSSPGRHHNPTAADRRRLCGGLLNAADWRLVIWLHWRPPRPQKSMLISVCMMCFGSLVIACLPGYESIGIAAPALLLLARMFQGLSVGGEYGTSATYMSEVALEGRKGFYASFQYVTLIGGQLAAVLTVVVLQFLLTDHELRTWGWRIPFF